MGKNLKKNGCLYMDERITLYSRNDHNIVSQLYLNKTLKNEEKKKLGRTHHTAREPGMVLLSVDPI